MKRDNKIHRHAKVRQSEEIRVVSSGEENPRRETEVDPDEERVSLLGPEKDESIELEAPLRVPHPTDAPLDITPVDESDGQGLGLVDKPDSETIAEYERSEEEERRDRRMA